MEPTHNIGLEIRGLRKQHRESLVTTAKAIGVERSYLNKIELGAINPSPRILDKIIDHFSVEGIKATELRQKAGHIPFEVALIDARKEEGQMAEQQTLPQAPQITINPAQTPVLFTDSTFVSSSDYGLVLDIAQTIGGQQHNVVARIGMSFDHAKKLIEVMQDHIEKNER